MFQTSPRFLPDHIFSNQHWNCPFVSHNWRWTWNGSCWFVSEGHPPPYPSWLPQSPASVLFLSSCDRPVTAEMCAFLLHLLWQLPIQRQCCRNSCPDSLSHWTAAGGEVHAPVVTGWLHKKEGKRSVRWLVTGGAGQGRRGRCHADKTAGTSEPRFRHSQLKRRMGILTSSEISCGLLPNLELSNKWVSQVKYTRTHPIIQISLSIGLGEKGVEVTFNHLVMVLGSSYTNVFEAFIAERDLQHLGNWEIQL